MADVELLGLHIGYTVLDFHVFQNRIVLCSVFIHVLHASNGVNQVVFSGACFGRMAFLPYVMHDLRGCEASYISRTIRPRITKFYTVIHTDLVYSILDMTSLATSSWKLS